MQIFQQNKGEFRNNYVSDSNDFSLENAYYWSTLPFTVISLAPSD